MEKELNECINIEQMIGRSIKHLSTTLDTMVGKTAKATRRESTNRRDSSSDDQIDDHRKDSNLLLMSS